MSLTRVDGGGLTQSRDWGCELAGKPNILFFFTDQQRWDTCGSYGQRLEVTPALDRMAAQGVRFERAFTCQPVCGPARAVLQTGKYATETGCFTNNIALRQDEKTIAHWMSELGYETGYVGKWHLASTGEAKAARGNPAANYRTSAVPPERRGGYRDHWLVADALEHTSHGYDGHLFDADMNRVEFRGYRAERLTDFALDFLRSRSRERPWFLFLSYIEPHHQNDRNRYEGPAGSKERFAGHDVPGDLVDTGGDWRENFPDYLGCCRALDDGLGRILSDLEERGVLDDTLVVFTSDHGSHFRTRNSEYKRSCHEASIRIPMVVRGPGFRGGKVVSELVSLIDLPPTLLAAASCGAIPTPPPMHGRPLQGPAAGDAAGWPDDVFVQISEAEVGRAVRTARWKYSVRSPNLRGGEAPGDSVYREAFLYDLDADPHERANLVADPSLAAVRDEMRARLLTHMERAGEPAPLIEPAHP